MTSLCHSTQNGLSKIISKQLDFINQLVQVDIGMVN